MMKTAFASASFALVLAAPAFAQQMTEQDFVTQAASGGMYEVQSSQLVLDQAQADEPVLEFAEQMVQDHTKANDELAALAREQNLEVPAEMQPEQQQMLEELQNAEGEADTYVQQQVMAHQKTVDLFQAYAEEGDDGELKQFAEQTLPTLQEHLEMVQSLPGAK